MPLPCIPCAAPIIAALGAAGGTAKYLQNKSKKKIKSLKKKKPLKKKKYQKGGRSLRRRTNRRKTNRRI